MRTALYVFEPSTVTIRSNDPGENSVRLCRFNRKAERVGLGARQLEPGIYLIVSGGGVGVSGGHISVVALLGDKDEPPEPKVQLFGLEGGVTHAELQQFFAVAKGIEVTDDPAQPQSASGVDKIADDPDDL